MPKWTDSRLEIVPLLDGWSSGTGSLQARLAGAIRTAAGRGLLPGGSRLPPERTLAEALEVSRTTVVLAYKRLRDEGLVESRQGSGTWIRRRTGLAPSRPGGERDRSFLVDTVTRAAAEEPAGTIGFLGACLPGTGVALEDAWREATVDVAEMASGTGYSPQGWPALRGAIAARLERRGLPTSPDEILVTNGAQQAIDLVGRLIVGRGDAVVVEDPTYAGAIDALTLAGARLLGVPVSSSGVDIEALRRMVRVERPALAYLVPSFHNPTGGVMPEAARREVAELADASGALVVEDESLADLGFGPEPPPPIAAFSRRAAVLTVGSLSKLYWGGLRVGWVRGPRPLVARLTRAKVAADLSGSPVSQALAVRLMQREGEVVPRRRRELREGYERLAGLLRATLPDWSWVEPQGGLTLWVRLPSASAEELARVAPAHGVVVVPGSVHSAAGAFGDRLRLPYVLDADRLSEGVTRLARAWRDCRRGSSERRLGVVV
jgi:DNA-binding transcriptional MocR family regulator